MNGEYKNYYKIGRESAGLTQESASELLGICVKSLSDYENGKTIPNENVVQMMVKVYQTKILGWWHLRNTSSLARECLPEILEPQSNADIYMQIDFSEDDICDIKKSIKKILSDGKITENEMEDFKQVQEKARITAGKLMSVYTFQPVIPKKRATGR